MNQSCVPKPDFVFLRMNIHIYSFGRHLQVKHERRVASVIQHVLERRADGVSDHPVFHGPAVDEEELPVGLGPVVTGFSHPSLQRYTAALFVDLDNVVEEIFTHHALQAPFADLLLLRPAAEH